MSGESRKKKFILWFDEIGIEDVPLVGGKNASLGEMYRKLTEKGVQVPYGFAITAYAYQYLLKKAGVEDEIREVLKDLDTGDIHNLKERGRRVRELIRSSELPEELKREIVESYRRLSEKYGAENVDVAVRSSATAEDLPDASFAGQQETYLNIRGEEALLEAVKKCFASLFTDRAISYRVDKGFDHFSVYLSIAVQKMVRSDAASSGVMFTIDTESGFKDVVLINGAWGLGENVVQGKVNPDEFYVFKPTLKEGYRPIIGKNLGEKQYKMIYSDDPQEPVKNVPTTEEERSSYVLTDDEILTLAKWGTIIEEHYGKPMDIEWAKDGDGVNVGTGQLFIVQARPETVHGVKKMSVIETFILEERGDVLVEGKAVGDKIGQGKVHVIESVDRIGDFRPGEVLVTTMTDPDWEPIMKIASAIVTDQGGRTCHAAIISRELGIPAIVGAMNATKVLTTGEDVTVSCAEGEVGRVYRGLLRYRVEKIDVEKIPRTRTKIMMNAGIPENAFVQGQIPNDGVGLAREEFIINSHIGIHPNALLNFVRIKKDLERLKEMNYSYGLEEEIKKLEELVEEIEKRTAGYEDKAQFFVDKLAQGIARIAAGFWPNDVIVRFSDFKTNEYANLLGGFLYEPHEHNPMIGWRGASRYYDPTFKEAFGLECKAIKKVRDEMGLKNVKVMVPFCRTPEEGCRVIKVAEEFGLRQGEGGLEFYVMAEIPSNVIAAEEFADIFDGFSIGSNDLTQLALGLDRDSELVAHLYNENEPAVKRLVSQVIKVAKRRGRKIGICGQAPSDYPEFAEFLVREGIDSISLNPDTVLKTRLRIAELEKKLGILPEQ
ncbi:MAG: phosphoenolpyruvate synthase [Thermoplasmata archaeon]|nr:MAG: phosphoenolpyruvate synthase [Thermoplasmata archaeon]